MFSLAGPMPVDLVTVNCLLVERYAEPRPFRQRDHPIGVAEERMDHEVGLVLRPDARADGRPEMLERPPGDRPGLLRSGVLPE